MLLSQRRKDVKNREGFWEGFFKTGYLELNPNRALNSGSFRMD